MSHKKASTDPGKDLHLYSRIGMYNEKVISVFNSDGTDYDLSDVGVEIGVKKNRGDADFITLTEGNGITITDNDIHFVFTEDQSSLFTQRTYYWQLRRTIDGNQKAWLNGDHDWHNGKFDSFSNDGDSIIISEDGESISITINDVSSAGGSGNVVGPASSVDSRMVEFDGTTGKVIKDGGVVVSTFIKTLLDDANVAAARATLQAINFSYRSGRYYSNALSGGSTTTQALAANTLRAWLFRVETAITFTEIISEVTTLAGLTSYRVGLYNDSAGYPSTLVPGSDVGTYDSTGNGVKTSGSVSVSLTPGYYWIALNSNGTPTLRAHAASSILNLGSAAAMGANCFVTAVTVSLAYDVMPATFTIGGTYTLLPCPIVGLKAQ